jgi:hypothetical protein
VLIPSLRHVATCLACGWRQPTRLTNSYGVLCPNDGRLLEHDVVAFDSAEELDNVRRDGHIRRGFGRRGRK